MKGRKRVAKSAGGKAARKGRTKRSGTGHRRHRSWRRVLAALLLLLVMVGAVWVGLLDLKVRHRFEGSMWSLPARVYARPLELYAGLEIGRAQLRRELELARYRAVRRPDEPGEYRLLRERLEISTRPFRFWDGEEPGRHVVVRLESGRVAGIRGVGGDEIPLLRLDPALVASFYPAHREDRLLVRLEEVPPLLVDGLLSVEDHRFLEHHGLVPGAILRALIANLRAGHTVQGGSTLTQQLVKNFFLGNQRTLARKLEEAVMALLVELHFSKRQILEAYLNEVYLGQEGERSIHGFGLAARFWFDKPLERLALHQQALLVGLVKGPSWYDPRRHPERALERRNLVLKIMAERGVIDRRTSEEAAARPLDVTPQAPAGHSRYPAFVELVRRQLRGQYREEELRSAGLQIHTTLDPWVQEQAQKRLAERLAVLEKGRGIERGSLQGAVVVSRAATGEVLAVAGGREGRYAGFNRALDARRPVGSLIKPLVYLAALEQPRRYTLATLLDDSPLTLVDERGERWSPRNYDGRFHGRVPLYLALAHSYNVATVRLGMEVGVESVVELLHRLGLEREVTPWPSLLLGAVSLSPLEVAQLYQGLADGGFTTPLRAIRAVLDAQHRPLSRYPLDIVQAVDDRTAFLTTAALERVVAEGTARGLKGMLPDSLRVAGKTGTTDDLRDSWFAGFSRDHVAVVWVGRDDNRPMGLSGAAGALGVWGRVMGGLPTRPLRPDPPAGIEYAWIDPVTGLRTGEGCEGAVRLPFVVGSLPSFGEGCGSGIVEWLKGLFGERE